MIGIAFQGCACRAAFHAGVAAGLAEAGIEVGISAGASSGSLIAVAVAAGRSRDLPAIWGGIAGRSVISLRRALWNRSLFDMSHLVRHALIDHFETFDLRAQPVEALVVATRMRDLRRVIYSSRSEPDLLEPMLASCYLPILYGRTVRIRGELMVDGGITDNLPIEELAARGASDVIAVLANADGAVLKSLRHRRWSPSLARSQHPHHSQPRLHVIKPARPLHLRSWDLDRDRVQRAIEDGHRAARDFADRNRGLAPAASR